MEELKLAAVESAFADIVWENAPLTTTQLVDLCAQPPLNWKRTTTYTVLKKLCLRSLFSMENGLVTVLIPKEQFRTIQCEQFVSKHFSGSLPAFIAAFTSGKALSQKELEDVRALLDSYEGASK